jgi:hypothetical protein
LYGNEGLFIDQDATQHFVSTLQHKTSTLQRLPEMEYICFYIGDGLATFASTVITSLKRHQHLKPCQRTALGTTTWTAAATAPATAARKQHQNDA